MPEKVLQFGEGNFLRAFCDWMFHRFNQNTDFNGSVVVVQPIERGMVEALNDQDGVYTLFLNGLQQGRLVQQAEKIEVISRGIDPYTQFEEFLATARQPELRIVVSNTTEAGIAVNLSDRLSDAPPSSFPGKLTAWLYERFRHFHGQPSKGMCIIPCELIEENGEKLRNAVLTYARFWELEDEFIRWVYEDNLFCNSLVDRIVPGYPKTNEAALREQTGYHDALMVEAEWFHLWVIEGPRQVREFFPDDLCGLNILFTDNLKPYRSRKVRILNGAHTAMVPVGYLAGLESVRQVVEHPLVGEFVRRLIFDEIAPLLPLPRSEVRQFAHEVLERFANPFIHHQLASIALNSFSKFETRLLPTLSDYHLQHGQVPPLLCLSLAALIRFYEGITPSGEAIPLNDMPEVRQLMNRLWNAHRSGQIGLKELITNTLSFEAVWKQDLSQVSGLVHQVHYWMEQMEKESMENVLKHALA